MNTKATADTGLNKSDPAEVTTSLTSMHRPPPTAHRPAHCALDTEETAYLDEVQQEAALGKSVLRSPDRR